MQHIIRYCKITLDINRETHECEYATLSTCIIYIPHIYLDKYRQFVILIPVLT